MLIGVNNMLEGLRAEFWDYFYIEAEDLHKAYILNLCHSKGIDISRIGDRDGIMHFRLSREAWQMLEPLLLEAEIPLLLSQSHGLKSRFLWLFKHYFFCLGAIIFTILLVLFSNIAFSVEVRPSLPFNYLSEAEVRSLAAECGIKKFGFIPAMDFDRAEAYLRLHNAYISFAGVFRAGTKLYIDIREKSFPKDADMPAAYGDIVAPCDAVIEELIVLEGTAQVAIGDEVKAGQVLIAGIFNNSFVEPSGIIKARVKYCGNAAVALRQEQFRNTEESAYSLYLCWDNEAQLIIVGESSAPYEHFNHRDQRLPLRLLDSSSCPVFMVRRDYFKQEVVEVEISYEQAMEAARELALAEASAQLPLEGFSLVGREIVCDDSLPSEAQAKVVLEVIRNFGIFKSY